MHEHFRDCHILKVGCNGISMTGCGKQPSQADPGRDLLAELCKPPSPGFRTELEQVTFTGITQLSKQNNPSERDTSTVPHAPGFTITGSPRDKEMSNDCNTTAFHCTLDPAQWSSFLMAAKMLLDLH